MRSAIGTLLLVLCVAVPASAQKRGLLPADYYKEVTISDVAVSPTAVFVAFTVTTIIERENRRHSEIWLERLVDGRPDGSPFRFSDASREATLPTWSPDGKTLAFTSPRANDPNTAWFASVPPIAGDAHHVRGVEGRPAWSPDGNWIAFVSAAADDEREASATHAGWVSGDALSRTLDPERFDGRVITSARYKRDGMLELLPDRASRQTRQLYVVPAAGGRARQLTPAAFDVGSIAWSPDSRLIVMDGSEHQSPEADPHMVHDLYVVARDGGTPRRLTTNPGAQRSPCWSPAGNRLAFVLTPVRNAKPDVVVVDVDAGGRFAGEPRVLTANWDLAPGNLSWTADGRAVRFEAETRGDVHLFEVAIAGGPVRQVTTGDRTLSSIASSRDGRVLAYAADDPLTPTELFVASGDGSGERRATSFNDAWLSDVVRVPPERLAWRVADGTEIEGWLVKPVGFKPGRKYPLVLKIHGGPHTQYGNTWFGTFHILSNAGMFVLYCNPRGSTGYGHRFAYATRGRWGEMDSEDLLKGLDSAIARYPEIDPRRLGVAGGSYGGYMTNWLTATTTRFAAAVTSRTISNWESWYGASDDQGLTDYEFYGAPWEQRERYRRLSPMSHVEQVRTPTLILEGENDYRTPMVEGEQWFMALKKRHVPVELVRYPRSSHGLSRTGEPWLLVDRLERLRSWFVQWLIQSTIAITD
ncbi:MAG: prolyl oligopeptidase family serine peptidase [Bacteroidales bacterium]